MVKASEERHHGTPMKSKATHTRSKSTAKASVKASNGHTAHPEPSAHGFTPSTEAVAIRAYLNYENNGAVDGHDVEHWLAAEAALRAEQNHAHK